MGELNISNKIGRLLVFIVAYNAEKTIESVLKRIPVSLASSYEVEVLIIDDSSQDETFMKGELARRSGLVPFPLTVLFNPVNQGYGGNQKIGFHYALLKGFDWVALVHGDGQYAPECLPDLITVLAKNEADAVFGSRMMHGNSALQGGMPLYKFVGNKILTRFQNTLLGSSLSEFHSGYRLYSTKALAKIPFELNSNDFHFDTEIIIQLIKAGLRIKELPIPTFYGDEICHVNGMKYALDVCLATMQATIQKYHIFYDRKFDCLPQTDGPSFPPESFQLWLCKKFRPHSSLIILGEVRDSFLTALKEDGHQICYRKDGLAAFAEAPEHVDTLLLFDDSDLSRHPEQFMQALRSFCKMRPKMDIIVTVGNIGFCITRLLLLLGRFSYSKKGIINFWNFRFFTMRSLKRLFDQYWFTCTDASGLPLHYEGIISSKLLATMLTAIHRMFIKLRPSFFSYQLLCTFQAKPSLEYLLDHAMQVSEEKSKSLQ